MCGIVGTVGFGSDTLIREMAAALVHRGPDDDGFFHADEPTVHLGNRRLSVIDVAGGRQPVFNETGDIVAVQNGEIYNYASLRRDLQRRGHVFCSQSDTEVLPHLYEEYGEAFARHLDGMFAVAVWDAKERKLVLARDQIGIKPLYLWQQGNRLAFASEVKALLRVPGLDAAMDLQALHFLLNVRFIPTEQSLFRGVMKLPPAHTLVWQQGRTRRSRYWSLSTTTDLSIRRPEDCAAEVRRLLTEAVKKQMVADVPLGLYLSGGIDSSALVGVAAGLRSDKVRTFTLGFNEPTDELADARLVADRFATDHHERTIDFDALSIFPEVTWHVEEPKENAIQLFLLARHAREHVTVALSGLGGDELFGGYKIYDWMRPTLPIHYLIGRKANASLLWPLRNMLMMVVGNLGSLRWDLARRAFDFALSSGVPERSYALMRNMWEHDQRLFSRIYTPESQRTIRLGVEAFFAECFDAGKGNGIRVDPRDAVMRAELHYKMVDDFLMNEDRTSMASSLEVRVPFLDRALVEFAFTIPTSVRFQGGLKSVLKAAVADLLPPETLNKPKWGFTFDSYQQFQKDLCRQARTELTPSFLRQQGIFNPAFIQEVLDHPPHRWMRWHYFLIWLMLGTKVWDALFVQGLRHDAVYDAAA